MAVGAENEWSPNQDTRNTLFRNFGKKGFATNLTTPELKLLLTNTTFKTKIEKKNKRKQNRSVAPNHAFFHCISLPTSHPPVLVSSLMTGSVCDCRADRNKEREIS